MTLYSCDRSKDIPKWTRKENKIQLFSINVDELERDDFFKKIEELKERCRECVGTYTREMLYDWQRVSVEYDYDQDYSGGSELRFFGHYWESDREYLERVRIGQEAAKKRRATESTNNKKKRAEKEAAEKELYEQLKAKYG